MKALIPLSHAIHVRNYVSSGWLASFLDRGHTAVLLVPGQLRDDVSAHFAGRPSGVSVQAIDDYTHGSFKAVLRGQFRIWSIVRRSGFRTYRHKVRLSKSSWRRAGWVYFAIALGRVVNLEWLVRTIERLLPIASSARSLIAEASPDLIFVPTLIHDVAVTEILKSAHRQNVPIVAASATWDTLTSKGLFLVEPDFLTVWGEQNRREAEEHHGFSDDRVAVTGPPQWDVYADSVAVESREELLTDRSIDPQSKVVLFAGTSINYMADEPQQIQALSGEISSGRLANTVIWYRPHPRRNSADFEHLAELPGIYVDEQVLRQRREAAASGGWSLTPGDLMHYRRLFTVVDGVITAMSTMIVEAAYFGKPSLVVGFGLDAAGQGSVVDHAGYEHIVDALKTPGVTLCRSFDELLVSLTKLTEGGFDEHAQKLTQMGDHIARVRDGHARQRITEVLESVAATGHLPNLGEENHG